MNSFSLSSSPRCDDALRKIPSVVRDGLGLRWARPLRGGGTPALVLLTGDDGGRLIVVKVMRAGAGLVDGHDLASFRGKARQVARIHRELPGLSPYYVPLAGSWEGRAWSAYAMPFIDGFPPTAWLRGNHREQPLFSVGARSMFAILGEHGYPASVVRAASGHGRQAHVARVARRIPLLARHLHPSLTGADQVRVNGRLVPTAPRVLSEVTQRAEVLDSLQPTRLYFPVHGDLNLGNVLFRDSPPAERAGLSSQVPSFTLVDPRGASEHWDPIYDCAKALFSLTLFEPAMDQGFIVNGRIGGDGIPDYQVALRHPVPAYMRAAEEFTELLGTVAFFRELDETDPLWRRRLLYVHAFHVLAEAACRLSDRTPRELPDVSGWAACQQLATGLYLSGLVLLKNLLDGPTQPEDDPARHLASIGDVTQPRGVWQKRQP